MAQANLRNAGDEVNLNAFGTSVIVDGNQLSNDGNMQTGGSTVSANKGIDLREISASNIESVEVVAGVPNAKYGNVTSGAIIINRKAGYTPYQFNINSTPESYQLGANKGYKLNKGGFINVDGDYTYSNSKATSRKRYYQRINAGLRWTKNLSDELDWNHNLSLRYGLSFDGQREDPDEHVLVGAYENRDHAFSFGTNGSLKLFGRTNYSINGNYRTQYSYKKVLEGGPSPIIESIQEGTVVTGYSPVSFYQRTEFFGKPLNMNGRLETMQTFKTFDILHNTNVGFEFSYDKNYGEGRVLDDENNAVSSTSGAREMNFYNVPASEVYSLYFQDDISYDTDKSSYLLKLGLRYDNMLRKYNLLSPRLSLSAKYFKFLRLRLAYGISYRTPSMLQRFPGPSYFDVINLNHYSPDVLNSVAVVTTYIFQPVHENLRPSKGSIFEGGFDIEHKGFYLRATGYHKELENGISSVRKLLTFDKQLWDVAEKNPGQPPVLVPTDSIVRVSSTFGEYENSVSTETNGLELSVQFPKIKATNTSVSFSGSYMKTLEKNEKADLRSSATLTGAPKSRYGLYENTSYNRYVSRSNLTIAQHIPEIKLMLTLMAETSWLKRKEVASYSSPYPLAYYSIDGSYYEIPESERTNEEYDDLYYSRDFLKVTPVPTYFNFHIQVRKETKQGHNFSFYANNFLWYNPRYEDDLSQLLVELNSRVTFGIGFNYKL